MSETSQNHGGRILDHLDGLRESLGVTPDFSWPPEYLEAFGAGEQPATVDRDFPECAHPECSEPFWEDGPLLPGPPPEIRFDISADCSEFLASVDYVASLLDDAIERAKQSHPANGRDLNSDEGLGLHPRTRERGQLLARELALLGGLRVHGQLVRDNNGPAGEGSGLLASGAGPGGSPTLRLRREDGRGRVLRLVDALGLRRVK